MMLQTAATNEKSWGKSCSWESTYSEDSISVEKLSVAISSRYLPIWAYISPPKGVFTHFSRVLDVCVVNSKGYIPFVNRSCYSIIYIFIHNETFPSTPRRLFLKNTHALNRWRTIYFIERTINRNPWIIRASSLLGEMCSVQSWRLKKTRNFVETFLR